jgi:hypothetical protein
MMPASPPPMTGCGACCGNADGLIRLAVGIRHRASGSTCCTTLLMTFGYIAALDLASGTADS